MKPLRVAPSAEHVLDTAQILFPPPAVPALVRGRTPTEDSGTVREFLFVPSAARPRLLLPGASSASAAAALRRYSHALGTVERIGRAAGAAAVRTGLVTRFLRDRLQVVLPAGADDSSIEAELSRLLGEPVVISLGLGNRRANQKPVLQVLRPDGRSLAFVKVGDNDVTRPLVRAEAQALEELATLPLRGIRIPRVLHLTSWRGLDLLVLSPLRTTARRRAGARQLPVAAFTELATAAGVEEAPLTEAGYWKQLTARVEELGRIDSVPAGTAARFAQLLDTIGARHGDTVLRFGAWHGDWTPWNMSWERSGVLVWDWERYATGVPIGFDILHFQLRIDMARAGATTGVLAKLGQQAPTLLHHSGVVRPQTPAVLALYLLELCQRFTAAAYGGTGEPLRPRAQWLLDFVSAQFDVR